MANDRSAELALGRAAADVAAALANHVHVFVIAEGAVAEVRAGGGTQ